MWSSKLEMFLFIPKSGSPCVTNHRKLAPYANAPRCTTLTHVNKVWNKRTRDKSLQLYSKVHLNVITSYVASDDSYVNERKKKETLRGPDLRMATRASIMR